ncbi:heme exporter protein CcmB [Hyphomonas johnsonii]|uniref:Heme exporter protein B n=1 Tax=Hyphomonas johnsonii MHS-2 TaxID=1280950 RepID=A0A059FMU4_9PROT|nr:heme exporter protein CcmB [Hyphomonas johnsonii]KCZ91856.1 heme exporter protein CcmB [Hyphomonas johnsonii MHS-2]
MSPAPILSAFRQALGEAWAGGAGALLPLGFFAGAAVLVPLGIGTEPGMLRAVGPGILWVALALSSLVTLERIFQADVEDGALDLWLQAGAPVSAIAAAKTFAHWLTAGLPLALMSPVLALMFQADADVNLLSGALAYGLGGLAFFFWGGVGAALSATVRRGGLLIALIALPLYVPTAIFGSMAVSGAAGTTAAPLLLAASTLFALAVAPFAMAAALRLAAD